jgi:hypothetical protein
VAITPDGPYKNIDTGGEFIKPAFLQVVHSEKIKEFRHSGEFATSVNVGANPKRKSGPAT